MRSNFSNAQEALEKKKNEKEEKSQPMSFQISAISLISHAYSSVDKKKPHLINYIMQSMPHVTVSSALKV